MDNLILKLDLTEGMKKLKFKERLVLRLLYYYSYSESTLGAHLGVSRSRIRNIKNIALEKLRENMSQGDGSPGPQSVPQKSCFVLS